jgi:hypothetical protein
MRTLPGCRKSHDKSARKGEIRESENEGDQKGYGSQQGMMNSASSEMEATGKVTASQQGIIKSATLEEKPSCG